MRFALAIAMLAGGLGGCATLNTSGMSEPCRDEYNACLDTCQAPSRASNRFPEGPASNKPRNTEVDFDTPGCVSECNERAKSCS